MSEKSHWNHFYSTTDWIPKEASTFAEWCLPFLDNSRALLEYGCGSGRDSLFFIEKGVKRVVGTDIASSTIDKLTLAVEKIDGISFLNTDFTKLPPRENLNLNSIGTVYARFTLHAIRKHDASECLKWAYNNLDTNGLICIEARSTKGDLYGKGEPVEGEKDAFVFGHYRRFINGEELRQELEGLGFVIDKFVEDKGLAAFRDDDPVVVRVIAKKGVGVALSLDK